MVLADKRDGGGSGAGSGRGGSRSCSRTDTPYTTKEQQGSPAAALTIDSVEQAAILLKPLRLELMQLLSMPRTCTELGDALGLTPQKVYYHVKLLEKAGLINKVRSQQVRGISEGIYQARARNYWLSPELTTQMGGKRRAQRSISLQQLTEQARQIEAEAQELASEPAAPALSINAAVELQNPALRREFMADAQRAVQEIAQRYGAQGSTAGTETYRLMLACYRRPGSSEQDGHDE